MGHLRGYGATGRRGRALISAGAVVALCLAAAGSAYGTGTDFDPNASEGDFSTVCPDGGNLQVDPIGQYHAPQSDHMHSFVGQSMDPFFEQALHPSRQPQDLKPQWLTDDGDGSRCQDITPDGTQDVFHDVSEYWVPALLSSLYPGQFYSPSTTLIYYRDAGVDPDTIMPFPDHLSMVGGHMDGSDQAWEVLWSCVAPKDPDGTHHEVDFGETIPQMCPQTKDGQTAYSGAEADQMNYSLRLVVYFPDCINLSKHKTPYGAGQWVPDPAEYALYPNGTPLPDPGQAEGEWGTRECDTDSGYEAIPQVQVGFRWALADLGLPPATITPGSLPAWDLSSLGLSSDSMHNQTHGASAHADFMSGWTYQQIQQLLVDCYYDGTYDPGHPNPRNCGHINNP